jgi:hypothetical protein
LLYQCWREGSCALMRRALEGMAEEPTPFLFFQRLTRRH